MPAPIKTAFRRVVFLLALYSFVRFLFLLNNWSHLKNENAGEIAWAFVHGLRFDLSIILTLNLLFIIIWIIPTRLHENLWFKRVLHGLFVVVNTAFLTANLGDVEYVNFNARRMTWAVFTLKQDVSAQMPQLMTYYWWLTVIGVGLLLMLIYMTPKRVRSSTDEIPSNGRERASAAVIYLCMVFLIVLGIRGGLQNKPVREAHAFQGSPMLGHLTLNTPFTLIHSRKKSVEKELRYVSDDKVKEVLRAGVGVVKPVDLSGGRAKNVVLIILESFSREYMGEINGRKGYTPFLDSLVHKSLFFANHYANARRSIDAIPALLSGLPALLREPFLLSSYQAAQVRGLAQILSHHGYQTAFFHGAENGSMFFDSFTRRIGYARYFGMSEYPEPKRDWDGFWGILDEPFLHFFVNELNQMRSPFFATVFTLSSHQPYPVPDHLKDKFPAGTLEIHKSIGYTDYALAEFFKKAAQEPWFKDTLFVITADHTQKSDDPAYAGLLGPYRVPLLFYRPGAAWAGQTVEKVTQHVDIPASILDYLGYEREKMIPLGQSVFSGKGGYFVARESDFFIFHSAGCTAKMSVEGEWVPQAETQHCEEREKLFLQAYVQYFMNGVLRNALF